MHKAFYEGSLLLSYCFYHVTVWDVLELLPLELPLTVILLELPLMISEEVVQVV